MQATIGLSALRASARSGLTALPARGRRSGFPAQPAEPQPRLYRPCAAKGGEREVQVAARQEPSESPFLEPFVRSMLLGLGAAVMLECAHETIQFLAQSGMSGGNLQVALQALPPPLFVADHVAAIAGWLGFYLIEAVAIAAVLKNYTDEAAAMPAIRSLTTLPKKMLPIRLQLFKQLFLGDGLSPASATASPGAVGSLAGPTAVKPSSPEAAPALPTASAFVVTEVDSPTAVLPRPEYPRTLPLPQSQPPRAEQAAPTSPRKNREVRTPKGGSNIVPLPAEGTLTERRQRKSLAPGQWDPDSSATVRREQELVDRRGYLTNFWYCAGLSQELQEGKPLGVKMLDKQFVLYRQKDGSIVCLDDACPHRGAPLSEGWLAEVQGHDCVVCPYHGWALDKDGALQDVPAAEHEGEWPKRPIVPSHDVVESDGFIWMFHGAKSYPQAMRPPIPSTNIPQLTDPSWKPVFGKLEFKAPHCSVFDNAIDMSHIHYVHADSFGNEDKPEIRDMKVTKHQHHIEMEFVLHNKPVNALWEFTKVPFVTVRAKAFLPSTSYIEFELGFGVSFITVVNTVPISANKTVNYFSLIRCIKGMEQPAKQLLNKVFNMGLFDFAAVSAMHKILGEDRVVLEKLIPEQLPKEYSVRSDLPQIEFRKLRQEWVDLGYWVPTQEDKKRMDLPGANPGRDI